MICVISVFSNLYSSNSRTNAIVSRIEGKKIVLTADFNHARKCYFNTRNSVEGQVLLHVPAYKKNISVKRVWSHIVFALKVHNHLRSLKEKPQIIYCAVPTPSSAYVCARYCKKNGIKFIIDVIDLWPDSLLPLVKYQKVLKVLLFPWTSIVHYVYRNANIIMGESLKYVYEAKRYNNEAEIYPMYLGVNMHIVEKVKSEKLVKLYKPDDEIWIAYAGSLGWSYDFLTLLESIKEIHGKYRYKLWFIGDGVRHEEIAEYIKNNALNAEITGFVSYEQLLGYLDYCDIAVNIFRDNTRVVYSYKFNDYVAMNCFVLNSLSGETAEMVDEYQIGRNFNFSDSTLSDVLKDTLKHWSEYCPWKHNCIRLINEKLDKDKIYEVVKDIFS